ncbi:MlaD family protein [Aquipseudomonas alcaligenes]|uniref:Paraquat-inducible protein B n=1 Tax=Aquipseudomonas alcaligenes TaxID=43263 RepID=A0AA37FLT4_AQUAC|nr:MlaD family protein [Pseudomonas alcaligenes]BCR23223.1 paraquat-inducible protein B [Pseudomonas alcaligenes]GIZ68963.1 paraquat-inducible protein B [Pseudomonas alcaligenes]GIZ71949.1 paraquat-inducible protein B [Pseudomonas alcaligenes]GIZ76298.1 paraquat-inducible protein B [Pseudomonas alcaligenes]GIZ80372.1 paraquat-inducible protein B [Pseudomonas alcaligenes]
MSESRKPLLTGSFLLSGLFLLVVGTLLLSRDSWFSQPSEYVVYFKGALDGLDVGADVTYRGVKVGSVREIRLSYDRNIKDVVMPVILRIDPRQTTSKRSFDQVLEQLVQRGLRAQLQTPSLLTGKAIVALDIFPDTPGYVREPNELELPAIPSVPSRIDQAANLLNDLVAEIRELPLLELIDSATQAMRGIERLSRSDDLNNGLHSLAATLANLDRLSQRLDAQLPALLASAQRSSGELDATLSEIRQASAGLRQTLEQTNALLGDSRRSLGPESELQYQLGSALQELSRASKALQRTAESLEQQPQSLIFGKPTP